MNSSLEIKKLHKGQLALSFFVFLLLPTLSFAASLYLSPASGSYDVGDNFPVRVYVSSTDQAMNAVSGVVFFPSDNLEVTSLNKSETILDLWAEEPSFSNTLGSASFEGIVLNPGFTGPTGQVLTINFRVKSSGSAPISISAGSILANDGQGTEILESQLGAQFSLSSSQVTPQVETEDFFDPGVPSAPKITSSTHPDSDKWYNDSNPVFSWELPDDVNALETLVSKSAGSNPIILYIPPIEKKEVEDMEDGSWYFHLRFRNDNGWGATTNFRFQIDTENPERFNIREIERVDPTDPKAQFSFEAEDEMSGIDYYEIQIDGVEKQVWEDDGAVFITKALDPGVHKIIIKAFDKAGNFAEESLEFNITPLKKPVITKYKEAVKSKEPIIVEGYTDYTNSRVLIWVGEGERPDSSYLAEVDEDGNFTFDTADKVIEYTRSSQGNLTELKLRGGNYNLWAQVVDERGAKSELSDPVIIKVKGFSFMDLSRRAITVISVLIPLIILAVLLIGVVFWGWYHVMLWSGRLRKGNLAIGVNVKEVFDKLKKDIDSKIERLKRLRTRGEATKKKKSLMKKLEKTLDEIEEFLKEEEKSKKKK